MAYEPSSLTISNIGLHTLCVDDPTSLVLLEQRTVIAELSPTMRRPNVTDTISRVLEGIAIYILVDTGGQYNRSNMRSHH